MIDRARAEGWALQTVFDNGSTHPYLMIVREGRSEFPSDQAAGVYVVGRARQNSPLHKHALQLIMRSRVRTPRSKK